MAKIRDDFEGITIVRVGTQDRILKAGDKVPKGATVGAHLLAAESEPEQHGSGAVPPAGATGTAEGTGGASGDGSGADGSVQGSDPSGSPAEALTIPPKGGAGSGKDAWRAYAVKAATAKGVNIEIPDEATREDIIEALEGAQIPTE
jgi:hypothetical protein